jgi:hypothetical protein
MRFVKYDREELEKCGKAFVARGRKVAQHLDERGITSPWTDFVLDWFASTCARDRTVDACARKARQEWSALLGNDTTGGLKSRRTPGEFMLDLVHTTLPSYDEHPYWSTAYFDAALDERRPEIRIDLALESEFGKATSPKATRIAVLHDACKLALVKAKLKVMVFGTVRGGAETKQVVDDLKRLKKRTGDAAVPWLAIDLPWRADKATVEWQPTHEVF